VGDANTNGMPDSLEAFLAGQWSGNGDYDPFTCDSDGDGMCDFNEWMLGTDPFSYDSCFSTGFSGGAGGGSGNPVDITINWSSLPFKTYKVQFLPQLMPSDWVTLATNIAATPPLNSWTIEDLTNSVAFFRAVVEPSTNGAGGAE